jgi:class 3 adenylate cyclase
MEGEGTPLIACPAFLESFSLLHYLPEEQAFWARVAQHHRLIRFDWRGTGLSQREVEAFSIETSCLDIEAVASALRLKKFALWVSGATSPIGLTFAGTRPTQVSRLVAYSPVARTADFMQSDAMRAYAMLWRTNPSVAAQTIGDLSHRQQHPDAGEQLGRIYFESISGEAAARLSEAAAELEWDAGPYLSGITAPTLVMHRRGDTLFPAAAGQSIAARVKNARFLPLEGEIHYHALGDSAAVLDAMLAFLAEGERKPRAKKAVPTTEATPGGLKTVLFTDIVGHTEMMSRLGDAKGRAVLREHERITRETLKAHGGAEVKTMGDGFMASFGSVTAAVECAIALQRAFASHTELMPEPLLVRVGLNAGEPIEEDGDLFGATVILASRIAAKAGAGEILVPDTVRGLLSGKQFLFSDRGEFVPKGFDDAVRIFEVKWRE